jgi:hypothetical protein
MLVRAGYVPAARRVHREGFSRSVPPVGGLPGQVRGRVTDESGSVIPGATVEITVGRFRASAVSQADGEFTFNAVPHGTVEMSTMLTGFSTQRTNFTFDGGPRRIEVTLGISGIEETVTVSADELIGAKALQALPPSQNVVNLQARASGVLPIRVDVPRAGVSHEFVKPLVVGAETTVTLRYKRN